MATRPQPQGFTGGLDRWVTRNDVAVMAQELAACTNIGHLAAWGGNGRTPRGGPSDEGRSSLDVHLCSQGVNLKQDTNTDEPITDNDRHRQLRAGIASLAHRRRTDAIHDYANDRRLSVRGALDRYRICPTCGTTGPYHAWLELISIYCFDHHDDQTTEADRMITIATSSDQHER